MKYQVLLYYWYGIVEDPAALTEEQRALCERLGLKGRIIISHEGINGTAEGTLEATEEYVAHMQQDPRFATIHFKRSEGTGSAFPKLSVKSRVEIVSSYFGEEDFNPSQFTAPYIQAEELHEWITSGKEFYIVDMRNSYEHAVGHFEGSLLPPLKNFRDLKDSLPEMEHLKDKTVVTVCTGGVRCEKASGFLLKHGFKEVYQLYGGIVTYMEKYPNQHFLGKLYVFDGRITMGFNTDSPEHVVVGRCEKCGKPSENYVNDDGGAYRKHFICCEECVAKDAALTPVTA
jgi:UPF0176 protein